MNIIELEQFSYYLHWAFCDVQINYHCSDGINKDYYRDYLYMEDKDDNRSLAGLRVPPGRYYNTRNPPSRIKDIGNGYGRPIFVRS